MVGLGELVMATLAISLSLNMIMVVSFFRCRQKRSKELLKTRGKQQSGGNEDLIKTSGKQQSGGNEDLILHYSGSHVYHHPSCHHVTRKGNSKPEELRPCRVCWSK